MAKIIQATNSPGFGGLEMVIQDFHAWLLRNGHDARVMVLEGTALHKSLVNSGFEKSVIAYGKHLKSREVRRILRDDLDSPDTAFLFHGHRSLKSLIWRRLKAKTSMLSHTFYKSKKRDWWHRFLFSKIDRWIALTPLHQQNMTDMLGIRPERIAIIPNGVDLKKFREFKKSNANENEFHIGVVARLDAQKGQDLAIEAVALLTSVTTKKLYLHFYGEATPGEASIRPRLEELIKKHRLESQVVFEGFKIQAQDIFANIDLMWLPSHRETFGRCLIESMACGVAVVASRAGGVPDIIRDGVNGVLFETMNSESLVRQTIKLIENPGLRNQLQIQALIDVRKYYDIEHVFSRLHQAIAPGPSDRAAAQVDQTKKLQDSKSQFFNSEASFSVLRK